jgi:hypothetical protein
VSQKLRRLGRPAERHCGHVHHRCHLETRVSNSWNAYFDMKWDDKPRFSVTSSSVYHQVRMLKPGGKHALDVENNLTVRFFKNNVLILLFSGSSYGWLCHVTSHTSSPLLSPPPSHPRDQWTGGCNQGSWQVTASPFCIYKTVAVCPICRSGELVGC